MSLERRLQRLARQQVCRAVDEIAQQYGVPAAELVDDVQRFFALPEAEQDAELAEALAQVQARGDHEAVRILTQGWAAVRSYRYALMTGVCAWALMAPKGYPAA